MSDLPLPEALIDALEFYADPETYHAVAFFFDPPGGGWAEDFDEEHGHDFYDRPMPGKLARSVLARLGDESGHRVVWSAEEVAELVAIVERVTRNSMCSPAFRRDARAALARVRGPEKRVSE